MLASLNGNTLKQYNSAYKKWWQYCKQNNVDCYNNNVPFTLAFLTLQFKTGASYSTLNTIKSALSLILGKKFSKDERVSRFLKGAFKAKPSLPRYQSTWNPNIILEFLANWYPNRNLPTDKISKKLVALLALSTAQRVQTLSLIRLPNIRVNDDNVEIIITDQIKTSAPGRPMPRLFIPFFPEKEEICPARALISYIEITRKFRH